MIRRYEIETYTSVNKLEEYKNYWRHEYLMYVDYKVYITGRQDVRVLLELI